MTKKHFIALADMIRTARLGEPGRSQAYVDGYKAGRSDKLIGFRSTYVWASQPHEGEYVWNYAIGYRQAQLGRPF